MEVVEGNLRPKLLDVDHNNGQLGELIDLICLSWNGEAAKRPSFATITRTLKMIQRRILEAAYYYDNVALVT